MPAVPALLIEVNTAKRAAPYQRGIDSAAPDGGVQKGPIAMDMNVGTLDRIVRIVVGALLIAYAIPLGFPITGWNWLGWIGVIPLVTGIVGSCPAYTLLGLSTCPLSVGTSRR